MKNHINTCITHLKDNFGLDISMLDSHLVEAYDKKQFVFLPEKPILSFLKSNKQKGDIQFLSDLIIKNIKSLVISGNGNEYRLNHEIRNFTKFNNSNIDEVSNLFKELSYPVAIPRNSKKTKYTSQIFINNFKDEKIVNFYCFDMNYPDYRNPGFTINKRINFSAVTNNFSRTHVIQFDKNNEGFISLRFAANNKSEIFYFDDDLTFKDFSIKELIMPSVLVRQDFGDKLHSILEINIPFTYSDTVKFKEPMMRSFSGVVGLDAKNTHPFYSLSYESSYKTKDFRDVFNSINKKTKKEIKKPANIDDLAGIIEYWKLVNY